ncbi:MULTISPECIES: TOMM precursor leader peptide-binding protein [unclassified Coleofasciculus]|uniref:TOMM precursor leader peptide-binding protein n=1 Tax=unclassified Coleofasciculus TaxID=2692782 RepID=UPI0018811068|nr:MULTISPECIES: TOMM precursor leader peptide-binding protein [unclassified Coleofasciculus]MBE9128876.1 TOMM precursor leader peptide-binding protein [Coleofasciculus sp. LEGE 07081]MBE9151597.1 TOMM precursor leader peptide-binding protein [Coleofasciculus sp. LEGE 07092]
MINKPKFKNYFHVEILDKEVFLLSENDYFLLSGHLYEQVAPLIDGQHTVDDIIERLQGQASAAEVYYALMVMEQNGYIIEANDELSSSTAAFYENLNSNSQESLSRLKSTNISVKNCSQIPTIELTNILLSLQIEIQEEGDIEVVLTDDYLEESLANLNQKSLHLNRPWMLVKPAGRTIWIGPIFYPGKTGCWECLAQRLRTNRPVETYIQKQLGSSKPISTSIASLPSTLQTGLTLAATELLKWIIQGENQELEGIVVTLDAISLKTENHILVRRPQCPCCGNIDTYNKEALPISIGSRKKTFTTDGGHRSLSPEETLKNYDHHISPITGVVHSLKPKQQAEDSVIHSYYSGHNFAMMFDRLYFLRQTVRGKSGGKGKTDIQAKASALCEALERYSGIFQGDEIRQKESYRRMGDAAIHPSTCMNFSETQYKNREAWNAKSLLNQKVPEPFDEEREIEWTPVWSLTYHDFKYLPTAFCYYGYPREENPYCWANSNGAAAGNTKEEAILQGFMELVERDGVALWWYNRVKRPAVDLASFDEPYLQAVIEYYRRIHRDIWVLDLTTDLTIPTFVAISRRTDREVEDIVFGFGAHFDAKIAILRAITELNQILPAVLTMDANGSTQYRFDDPVAKAWWQTATLNNQPYLAPDANIKPKVYSDYAQMWSDDLRDDVMTCVQIAEGQGMEVLVLDQTRPDIGLNVVKVIAPGMRHFWKRLAPGRLYEVPVKLGWLSEPLPEHQLNPFPMFL